MNFIKKLKIANYLFAQFGLNILGIFSILKIPKYIFDLYSYIYKGGRVNSIIPMIIDNSDFAGSVKGHYFTMDLLVAKYIFKSNPRLHLDIGSRIDGFIGHIAVYIEKIDILDIRDLSIENFNNINFIKGDLLKFDSNKKYNSISSLHTIEHIGLGRYGDKINPSGHILAIEKIVSLLDCGGKLYLAMPIGIESVAFNAHRVLDFDKTVQVLINCGLNIDKFDYITTDGVLILNANKNDTHNEKYGCGIFVCTKKS